MADKINFQEFHTLTAEDLKDYPHLAEKYKEGQTIPLAELNQDLGTSAPADKNDEEEEEEETDKPQKTLTKAQKAALKKKEEEEAKANKGKEETEKMNKFAPKEYELKSNVRHDGELYKAGTKMTLTADLAKQFKKDGLI